MVDTEPFDRELAEANAKLLSVAQLKTRLLILVEDLDGLGPCRPNKAALSNALVDAQEAVKRQRTTKNNENRQILKRRRITTKLCHPMTTLTWPRWTTVR